MKTRNMNLTIFDHYQHHLTQFYDHSQQYECLDRSYHLHPGSGL